MYKTQNNKLKASTRGYVISLIIAMCLNILPLSSLIKSLNPDWVLLTLIYWSILLPEKVGVFSAWFVGFWVDMLTGRLLGQNALIYAIIIYSCLKLHKRLRHYLIPQQSLFIFVCLLFSQVLRFWIESLQGQTELSINVWWPALVGTIMWPIINLIAHYFLFRRPS